MVEGDEGGEGGVRGEGKGSEGWEGKGTGCCPVSVMFLWGSRIFVYTEMN